MVRLSGPSVDQPLQCELGGWVGGVPRCEKRCSPITWPQNANSCSATTLDISFEEGHFPSGSHGTVPDGWTFIPHMPDSFARKVAAFEVEADPPAGQVIGDKTQLVLRSVARLGHTRHPGRIMAVMKNHRYCNRFAGDQLRDSSARLSALFKLRGGSGGILMHYRDEENHVLLELHSSDGSGGSMVRVTAVINGVSRVIGERHHIFIPSNRMVLLEGQYQQRREGMFIRL